MDITRSGALRNPYVVRPRADALGELAREDDEVGLSRHVYIVSDIPIASDIAPLLTYTNCNLHDLQELRSCPPGLWAPRSHLQLGHVPE
jgi:hypothetical protein